MVSQMRSTLDFNSPVIMGRLRHRRTLSAHLTPWDEAGLVDEHVEVLDPSDEPWLMLAAINRPRTS